MWKNTEKGTIIKELPGLLMKEYGIDEEKAKHGVEALLASLRKEGVLEENE